jgi:hypothetical protein
MEPIVEMFAKTTSNAKKKKKTPQLGLQTIIT